MQLRGSLRRLLARIPNFGHYGTYENDIRLLSYCVGSNFKNSREERKDWHFRVADRRFFIGRDRGGRTSGFFRSRNCIVVGYRTGNELERKERWSMNCTTTRNTTI